MTITCRISGVSNARIEWRHENNRPITSNGGVLYLSNVKADDAGTYTCRAFGDETGGWVTTNMFVTVKGI